MNVYVVEFKWSPGSTHLIVIVAGSEEEAIKYAVNSYECRCDIERIICVSDIQEAGVVIGASYCC
jgi:hypothetical protein